MEVSAVKRFTNEINDLIENCDNFIDNENYYIVWTTVSVESPQKLNDKAKEMLKDNINQPLASYIFFSQKESHLLLIFPCRENEHHFLWGRQSEIISWYCSEFALYLGKKVKVRTIEFNSKNKIILFLSWFVYACSRESMYDNFGKLVTKNEIKNLTFSELQQKIGPENWEKLSSNQKYGVFYKLQKKNNKIVVVSLSEYIDTQNEKKYITFIFGG